MNTSVTPQRVRRSDPAFVASLSGLTALTSRVMQLEGATTADSMLSCAHIELTDAGAQVLAEGVTGREIPAGDIRAGFEVVLGDLGRLLAESKDLGDSLRATRAIDSVRAALEIFEAETADHTPGA